MEKMKKTLVGVLTACAIMGASSAYAVEGRDVQVAARTFGFIEGVPSGTLDVGIIYDPGVEASKNEANQMKALLGSGLKAGKHTLKPTLVEVGSVSSTSANVAFVTVGLGAHYDKIFQATSAKKMFTFTKDFSCLVAKKCIMAIETSPAVKIEISNDAASSSGIAFGQALKMMVKMKD